MTTRNLPPALNGINVPKHVHIETTDTFESLMERIGRKSMFGYSGNSFFGTAFIQGRRLMFSTGMPLTKMLEVSKIDRSKKKDTIEQVTGHSNRPEEPTHAKHLRKYLLDTACAGDLFILPSFTFNYGVGLTDEDPEAQLIIFGNTDDSTNAWPALFLLPTGARLDTTDGAHRRTGANDILESSKVADAQKDEFRKNAVGVVIVFEDSRNNSHQDFADCGRAKSIPNSQIVSFDTRDSINRRTRQICEAVPFLKEYVDATAAGFNLSGGSRMIWSLSALRGFTAYVCEKHPNVEGDVAQKTADAEKFFCELVKHLPQFKALDEARKNKEAADTVSTGNLRNLKGGDIALRGVALLVFGRAFLHCIRSHLTFSHMAAKLATIDWHVLTIEREELPDVTGEEYAKAIRANANPIWSNFFLIRDNTYRTSSSGDDADIAWRKITAELFPEHLEPKLQAAE